MSDTGGFGDVGVSFYADPASEARLASVIEGAITKGFGEGLDKFFKQLSQQSNMTKVLRPIEDSMKRIYNAKTFRDAAAGLKDFEREQLKLIGALNKTEQAVTTINTALRGQSTIARQEQIKIRAEEERTARARLAVDKARIAQGNILLQSEAQQRQRAARDAATERIQAERAAFDAIGRAERKAAQESIISTRVAGQQRVAITRAVIDQISRLERSIGSLAGGALRAGGSVLGRAGSGIGELFRRDALAVSSSNQLLSREMRERESIVRESALRTERVVRESSVRTERSLNSIRTRSSTGVTGALTGRGVGGGLGALGLGAGAFGIGSLLTQGFKDSTNLTEQLSKTKIVFGDFAKEIITFSESSVNALGATNAEALQSLAGFGALFRGFDIGQVQASQMSVAFTQLASDMASFSNTTVEEAVTALNAGLVGENEPLKRFGVVLNDAVLKAKALELGLYSGKGALDANAKAQAAFAVIMEKTALQQGNFALTADEGANAQKRLGSAVRQTFSDLAGLLKGVVTTVALGAIPVFTTLSSLISGKNLSEGLTVLRDALKGVGIALGAIIAAKGGVEVLQLLGGFAKLAFTPFGALVTVIGLLGAALGIFLPRSQALRDILGEVAETAKGIALPAFHAVVDFIKETAIPAITTFAEFVATKLLQGFNIVSDFITTTAIPALQRFGQYLLDTAVPAVVAFGQQLVKWFEQGIDKVQEFWTVLRPIIQPAIDGFKQLGSAIAATFDLDFSGLAAGLKAALTGIVKSVGTGNLIGAGVGGTIGGLVGGPIGAAIGAAIGVAVANLGPKILELLGGIFTLANFGTIAGGILDFVEFIGFTIGNNVDIIIKALGLIVAGAAVVAFRFAKGFIEGLANSIPPLLGELVGVIADNFETVITAAVLAIGVGGPLLGAFKSLGNQGAKGFASGFAESVKGQGSFISALLSGAQPAGTSVAKSANKAANADFLATQVGLRAAGSPTVISGFKDLEKAKGELRDLRGEFSKAQLAALTLRDQLSTMFTGARGASGGFLQALSGRGTGGVKAGLGQMVSAFKESFAQIKAAAAANGTSIGQQLVSGIKKGAAGLAVAFGGFLAGKAEGKAGGSGAISAIGAGLTGLAIGGPIVGAVAAGASLIGTELGKAERSAALFKEGVKELASALKGDLADGLAAGRDGLLDVQEALAGGNLINKLKETLSPDTIKALNEQGIGIGQVLQAFQGGEADVKRLTDSFSDGLKDGLSEADVAAIDLIVTFNKLVGAIDEVNQKQLFENGATSFERKDNPFGSGGSFERNGLGFASPVIPRLDTAPIQAAAGAVEESVRKANEQLATYIEQVEAAFGADAPTNQNQAIVDVSGIAAGFGNIDFSTIAGKAEEALSLSRIKEIAKEQLTEGIKDGTVKGADDAGKLLLPLLGSALEAITANTELSQADKDRLTESITSSFSAAVTSPSIPLAAAEVAKIFSVGAAAGLAGIPAVMTGIGVQIGAGLAQGMESEREHVALAAQDLVAQIPKIARQFLAVSSPSKVMIEIGRFVGEGLALGMQESMDNLGSIVTTALEKAIDQAKTTGDKFREVMRGSFGSLFDQFTGSGALIGPGGTPTLAQPTAQAGITIAINGFLSTFDGAVSKVFDLAKRMQDIAKGVVGAAPLSFAERDLIGESAFSLNPTDVLGAGNLASLTSAFDAIKTLGGVLLAQGRDPLEVANIVKLNVAQLKNQAIALGFNASEIEKLTETLGLSGDALRAFVESTEAAAAAVAAAIAEAELNPGVTGAPPDLDSWIRQILGMGDADAIAAIGEGGNEGRLESILAGLGYGPGAAGEGEAIPTDPTALLSLLRSLYGVAGPGGEGSSPPLASLPFFGGNTFNIFPPSGDPYAISLEIANRIASASAVPGG